MIFADGTRFIDVSVQYQSPCSPITIVTPNNNWILNGADTELRIEIRDYQPNNMNLEEIKLQYRRVDTGDDWADISPQYLKGDLGVNTVTGFEEVPDRISSDFLTVYNAENFAPGQTPAFYWVWELPNA